MRNVKSPKKKPTPAPLPAITVNSPRQAILVTFVNPTNQNLNNRWRAKCEAGQIIRVQDDDVDTRENAHRAAIALCVKLGWDPNELIAGSMPGNGGFCYVLERGWMPDGTPQVRPASADESAFLASVFDASERHGLDDDSDHEIGDLQQFAAALWREMSRSDRARIMADDTWTDFLAAWGSKP